MSVEDERKHDYDRQIQEARRALHRAHEEMQFEEVDDSAHGVPARASAWAAIAQAHAQLASAVSLEAVNTGGVDVHEGGGWTGMYTDR